ncbi:hypothetical protein [Limnohabitans sp.]|uniref:hypothetical protein n=1 Tax=Limnohabitans sp. TaxID=1907725 RepID=UPI002FDF0587
MRFSYMLHNKEGHGRRVPRGQAWQWTHDLESLAHLQSILDWIDVRVTVDRLSLLNVYLDHTEITAPKNASISFGSKSQIVYSKVTLPTRVIDMSQICANMSVHP